MQVQGIIRGNRLELYKETGLADGIPVIVDIKPMPLSLEEKRKLTDKLCGSWAEDKSLEPIFKKIGQQRHNSKAREANFEIPS